MNDTFAAFLSRTIPRRELLLAVAQGKDELVSWINLLIELGYEQVVGVPDLMRRVLIPAKLFFVIDGILPKDAYDFIAQYGTGQIHILPKDTMQPHVISPLYTSVKLIFVTTKEYMKANTARGFDIYQWTGVVFSSD